MDRDHLFTDLVEPLTWDKALNLAATDRAALAGYLAPRERCPLAKRMPVKTGRLLYRAAVIDERDGTELATVRSLTKSGGEKRLDRAFARELNQFHAAEQETGATS
jgi:hypothetical protein